LAGTGLIALLDDVASVLDDVALLTKVAGRKTAGVLGDDLALNAQQVAGVHADRELPVVWAVAKGSTLNKAILVPAALAISALAPWAIAPLLMAGGAFLCYEGVEKLAHRFLHAGEEKAHEQALLRALADPDADLAAIEREKIRGAIRTDFILSAEIIVIALGTVATQPFPTRLVVLAAVAVLMTAGVYGLVAAIVKLDDIGLALSRRAGAGAVDRLLRAAGRGVLRGAPWLMKGLSVAGTAAMFLVGGGILVHGVPFLHHAREAGVEAVADLPGAGTTLAFLGSFAYDAIVGVVAGALVLAAVSLLRRLSGVRAGPG
jgi:predicted DNA repair protein MutK